MVQKQYPSIIFHGKNFQSLWRGDMALPNTLYGVTVNSWIQTDVLADWFDVFADKNKGYSMKIKVTHFVTHVENL